MLQRNWRDALASETRKEKARKLSETTDTTVSSIRVETF